MVRECYTKLQVYVTQGHASTSKYAETASIRNNLFGILIPKTNIFRKRKLTCYEWEPINSIVAQANSATYKNFQARKNQNQAEAIKNPKD